VAGASAGAVAGARRLEPVVFHPAYTWLRAKAPGERTVEHADW
jgi:hypothetical protein